MPLRTVETKESTILLGGFNIHVGKDAGVWKGMIAVAYEKNLMGGVHSVADGGHLYLVCAVCDVTI